ATALPIMGAKLYSNFTENTSDEVTLYFHSSGETRKMTESEYILGISLAQIDKKYSEDALKAVAVAMRSVSYYLKGCCKELCHTDADYCDCKNNMPFINKETFIKTHGNSGSDTVKAMENAISATSGEFLQYKNSYALSLIHKSSYITTQSSFDALGLEYPYLEAVITPEKAEISEIMVIESEFKRKLKGYLEDVSVSDIKATPTVNFNRSGRVESVSVFTKDISASDFAEIFDIKSMIFEIEEVKSGYVIRSYGSGHGVGMSLAGAEKMCENSLTYREILLYYFRGCKMVSQNENN
ncbi:MAG: SpoIID/LytB domain-containing protein, partial [Clostridia bacterium]|nr:SpoIID/LytB domain-containing protein [Clostridia bacterium]